ncbi:type II toxin-antitoxin system VapC family toxin [Anabaena sphaerica]|uniref:type II toxin-antitoxin system VapC family toxin n=1 Tax=Anabaena sphaerica TaxID=212446 RepID=UPI0030CC1D0A
MSYLLDTNHCSYIINGNPQVTDTLKFRSAVTIGVSIITYAELLYMTEKSALKSQNLGAVQVFCLMLICILLMKKLLLFTVV